jgi:hypothetical protein
MLLTPEEISKISFNSAFEEAICLTLDFRFFYYRVYSRNKDIPYNPKYMEDLLQLFQSVGDLTLKEIRIDLLYSLVNIFPGAHKTSLVQYFIAWCYLREIRCNFIVTSSTSNLSEKILNAVKSILIDNFYIKSIFGIKLRSFAKDKGKLEVECDHPSDGVLQTGGVDSTFTGFNANVSTLKHFSGCVICDDPHSAGDTPLQIQSTIETLSKAFNGRVRNIETGLIFILGQLVARDDFSNYILNTYDEFCYHFKVPALNRFNESNYPQKFSRGELIKEKQRAIEGIGTDIFFLQKQQEVDYTVTNHTLVEQIYAIDQHEYNRLLFDTPNHKFIQRVFSVDTSLITRNGDPSAICVFSIIEKQEEDKSTYLYFLEKIYNLTYKSFAEEDVMNGLEPKPNYHSKTEEFLQTLIHNEIKDNAEPIILIEAGHHGTLLYDKISHQCNNVYKISTNKNTQGKDSRVKQSRMQSALTLFCTEPNIRFKVVKQPELEVLKKQVANLGRRSVNDDIADCVSMFLNWQYESECKNNINRKSNVSFGFENEESLTF